MWDSGPHVSRGSEPSALAPLPHQTTKHKLRANIVKNSKEASTEHYTLSTVFLSSMTVTLRLGLAYPRWCHNSHCEEKPFFQSLISQMRASFLPFFFLQPNI